MNTPSTVVNGGTQANGQAKPTPAPVQSVSLDADDRDLVLAFRDEYEKHFQTRISIPDLVSDLLQRGVTAQRNSMKWGTINRETRKVEQSAKADVADLLSSGPLTAEKKAEALDILLKAQEETAAIKLAARRRR
jgi:hypothetical protein